MSTLISEDGELIVRNLDLVCAAVSQNQSLVEF